MRMFEPPLFTAHPTIYGTPVRESRYAVSKPTAEPITHDMREMVEKLDALGEVKERPCVFMLPDETLLVHPDIMAELNRNFATQIQTSIEQQTLRLLRGRQ